MAAGPERQRLARPYYAGDRPRDGPLYKTAGPLPTHRSPSFPTSATGLVMVFRTFDRAAFALVMQASRQVAVNDIVSNP